MTITDSEDARLLLEAIKIASEDGSIFGNMEPGSAAYIKRCARLDKMESRLRNLARKDSANGR